MKDRLEQGVQGVSRNPFRTPGPEAEVLPVLESGALLLGRLTKNFPLGVCERREVKLVAVTRRRLRPAEILGGRNAVADRSTPGVRGRAIGNSSGPQPLRPNDWKALRLILAILPQPYWF